MQSQEPSQFRRVMEVPCKTITSESAKALKALATAMKTMTDPSPSSQLHLTAAKSAINDLKNSLKSATTQISEDISNLLAIISDAKVASILIEIVKSVEDLSEAVSELSLKAKFKSVSPEKPQLLHKGSIKPFVEDEDEVQQPHVVITVRGSIENNNEDENNGIVNKK